MRALALAFFLPVAAMAGEYDGIYRLDIGTWDCKTVGMDGGAFEIRDDTLYGVESECALTEPTPVNGMPATLFTTSCMAEGTEVTERIMLMTSADGLYMVRPGFVVEWIRCD